MKRELVLAPAEKVTVGVIVTSDRLDDKLAVCAPPTVRLNCEPSGGISSIESQRSKMQAVQVSRQNRERAVSEEPSMLAMTTAGVTAETAKVEIGNTNVVCPTLNCADLRTIKAFEDEESVTVSPEWRGASSSVIVPVSEQVPTAFVALRPSLNPFTLSSQVSFNKVGKPADGFSCRRT